jgi:hypothetical protein
MNKNIDKHMDKNMDKNMESPHNYESITTLKICNEELTELPYWLRKY